MGTLLIAIMAGFSTGYCITDMIMNYRANKRINQFVKEHSLDD